MYVLSFDVSDRSAVDEAFKSLPEEWKKIDILLNNAGLALGRDNFDEASMDDWETMIDTNLKGLLYVSKAVIAFYDSKQDRSHYQYRIHCRETGLPERKCLLCNQTCRSRPFLRPCVLICYHIK